MEGNSHCVEAKVNRVEAKVNRVEEGRNRVVRGEVRGGNRTRVLQSICGTPALWRQCIDTLPMGKLFS